MSQSNIIKQDINFLENPLWITDSRSDKRHKFEITLPAGKYIYEAAPDDIPDDIDALFLYYFLRNAQEIGKSTLTIGRYKTLKDLNFPTNNKSYERLQKSLDRWGKVYIKFEGSFYSVKKFKSIKNGEEVEERITERKTKGFHVFKYEDDRINTERITKKGTKTIRTGGLQIIFDSDFIKASEESNFYKYIDLNIFISLKSPLKRRLYEWLPKQFIKSNKFVIGAERLFDKLRINDKPYPSTVKRKLAPISGALASISKFKDSRYIFKVELETPQKNVFNFVFYRGEKRTNKDPEEKKNLLSCQEKKECAKLPSYWTQAIEEGLTKAKAESFHQSGEYNKDVVSMILMKIHDYLEKMDVENKGGLIYTAFKEKWGIEDIEREKQKVEKVRLAKEKEDKQKKAEAERKAEAEAAEKKIKEKIDEVLSAKTEDEISILIGEFRKTLAPFLLNFFDDKERGGVQSVKFKAIYYDFLATKFGI